MPLRFRENEIENPAVIDALKEIALELSNIKENYTPLDSIGVFGRLDDLNTWKNQQHIDGPADFAAIRLASEQHIELNETSSRFAGRIMSSLADDAIATVNTPDARPYGIVIMASNHGSTTAAHAFIGSYSLGRLATIHAGASIDNGDNVNNDTDLFTNIWMSSSSVISIKNRSGGTIGYTFFLFSG